MTRLLAVGEVLHSHEDSDMYHFLVLKRVRKPHPNLFEHFKLFPVTLLRRLYAILELS